MLKSNLSDNLIVTDTVQKTLMTSLLFEGFWDRWIAHGLEREKVNQFRTQLKSLEQWKCFWDQTAQEYEQQADALLGEGFRREAEYFYRKAGLHYNLIQWIFPQTSNEKRNWFIRCIAMFTLADVISTDIILHNVIQVEGKDCIGRIRIPEKPRGCVVIINPIDSSKEELFTYEMDFAAMNLVTVSFDGPGQGESYVCNEHKATRSRWNRFVNQVIDFTAERFPELPVNLFGTSSGGAWAVYGSVHPQVSRVVSVSPACQNDVKLPDYFTERLSYVLEEGTDTILPDFEHFKTDKPVLLFHGNKDVMVKDEDIYRLYEKLPQGKQLIEYSNEGHCCNFKLETLRQISGKWLLEDEK
ncbi:MULTISPECIES: alpha/beta hydrolase [unclassified Paenibacillus]|uniref:alpha/beta hydrolase n=1 Tax=unclassified Paenibacillus TaxID=185978 RepID=UPI001AE52EBF|nr:MULTISPECIES: alpha/beta hydrolase [unclassified Paenibacillus]MBP1153977.1 hypothetical protein [Paenibacillus sp. PvP091]MBP1170638.1 hypothetical protein [Paenibacillus sp. PvR098]MBP2441666.1 hypothetical protein [Paenibacillus sp. PvP052]